jgi:hypothetical protein
MAWLEPKVDTLRMDEARERQTRRRNNNRGDTSGTIDAVTPLTPGSAPSVSLTP